MSLDTTYIQLTPSNLNTLIIQVREKGIEQEQKYGNLRKTLDDKIFRCELLKSHWFDFSEITTARVTKTGGFSLFGFEFFKKNVLTEHVLEPRNVLHQIFIEHTIKDGLNRNDDGMFNQDEIRFILDEYLNNFEEKEWLTFDSLNPHSSVNNSFEIAINKLVIKLYEQQGEIEDTESSVLKSIVEIKETLEQSNSTFANVPQHILQYWLSVAYPEIK